MRRFALFFFAALPFTAVAAEYSRAPLLVVKPDPDSARPASPTPPPAPPKPEAALKPAEPEHPVSPYAKLWPKDTLPIFMTRCTQLHVELVKPCSCIIGKVMETMTHDVFMEINAKGEIETDPRLVAIREQCASEIDSTKRRPLQTGPATSSETNL